MIGRQSGKAAVAALLLLMASEASFAQQVTATFLKASDKSFGRPHDLVLGPDGRQLYVADLDNHLVKILDPESLATLASIGAGELSAPHDVTFDNQGRLLVADSGNDRIAIYEGGGLEWRLTEELTEALSLPEGVAVAPDDRIYVTNARADTVVVFRDGVVVGEVGRGGSGPNEYDRPHDIEVSADSKIYVADPGNDRLQILSLELELQGEIGGGTYDFDEPKYFDLDSRGLLIVADEYHNQIKILDRERRIIGVIGTGEKAEGPNVFNWPEGAELLDDLLWIADTRNGRIVLYRVEGLPAGE